MKNFFVILLLVKLSLWADTVEINTNFEYIKASPYMEIFTDRNSQVTFDSLSKVDWQKMTKTNLSNFKEYPSWTKFYVKNNTNIYQKLILKNPRADMDEIDVYIVRDSRTEHSSLGDNRPINIRTLPHRYSIVPLWLEAGEIVEIDTKLLNHSGSLEGEWEIYSAKTFTAFSLYESMWWGFYIGIYLAFSFYMLSLLLNMNSKVFTLLTGIFIVSSLCYQLSLNGILYNFGVSEYYINLITSTFGVLFGLSTICIILRFLTIFNHQGVLKWVFICVVSFLVVVLLIFLYLYYDIDIVNNATQIVILSSFLFYGAQVLFVKNISSFRKNKVLIYIFSAYAVILIPYAYQSLVMLGILQIAPTSIYSVSIGAIFEMYLFTLAMTAYIHDIENDKIHREKLLEVQFRFASIGKVIGNIARQWNAPLVRLGALLSYIDALTSLKKDNALCEIEHKIIPQFRDNLNFMQYTIDEFYKLYKGVIHKTVFSPYDVANNIWAMLKNKAKDNNISFNNTIDSSLFITSYEHHFAHILIILFDHSIIATEKESSTLFNVRASLNIQNNICSLSIENNCGSQKQYWVVKLLEQGLEFQEIAHEHKQIELFLIKTLIELKLLGSLHVSLTKEGIRFVISIPVLENMNA